MAFRGTSTGAPGGAITTACSLCTCLLALLLPLWPALGSTTLAGNAEGCLNIPVDTNGHQGAPHSPSRYST